MSKALNAQRLPARSFQSDATQGPEMSPNLSNKVARYRRDPALDGMRGIAILAVLCLHLHILRGGYLGVDIFFVLSGFLITSLLLNEIDETGRLDFISFFRKRCVRLLPPLTICLLLSVGMAYFEGSITASYDDVIASASYTSNYWHGSDRYLWHTWSLSLEAQFYLIWPFIVLAMSRSSQKIVYSGLLLFFVATLVWRSYLLIESNEEWAIARTYTGLDTRCDTLIAGAIMAFALRDGLKIRNRAVAYVLLVCLSAAILVVRPGHILMHSIGFSVFALSCAYILGYMVCQRDSALARYLGIAPLTYLGNISYGLYLYHFPIMQFLEKNFHFSLLAGALTSLAAAAASWHLIEKPILKSKPVRFSAIMAPTS